MSSALCKCLYCCPVGLQAARVSAAASVGVTGASIEPPPPVERERERERGGGGGKKNGSIN